MEKIPAHATRVHKGIIFDVYQWPQTMFDGSTKTFEAVRRVPGTEIIAVDGDEVLIAEQEQPEHPPYISLFGGRIDDGENPLSSAQRELLEESGYMADHWYLVATEHGPWSKLDWTTYLYVATGLRRVQDPQLDAGEKISVRRCGVEEFLALGEHQIHWKHPALLYEWRVKPGAADQLRGFITSAKKGAT